MNVETWMPSLGVFIDEQYGGVVLPAATSSSRTQAFTCHCESSLPQAGPPRGTKNLSAIMGLDASERFFAPAENRRSFRMTSAAATFGIIAG
jgi:hypothetical protein